MTQTFGESDWSLIRCSKITCPYSSGKEKASDLLVSCNLCPFNLINPQSGFYLFYFFFNQYPTNHNVTKVINQGSMYVYNSERYRIFLQVPIFPVFSGLINMLLEAFNYLHYTLPYLTCIHLDCKIWTFNKENALIFIGNSTACSDKRLGKTFTTPFPLVQQIEQNQIEKIPCSTVQGHHEKPRNQRLPLICVRRVIHRFKCLSNSVSLDRVCPQYAHGKVVHLTILTIGWKRKSDSTTESAWGFFFQRSSSAEELKKFIQQQNIQPMNKICGKIRFVVLLMKLGR